MADNQKQKHHKRSAADEVQLSELGIAPGSDNWDSSVFSEEARDQLEQPRQRPAQQSWTSQSEDTEDDGKAPSELSTGEKEEEEEEEEEEKTDEGQEKEEEDTKPEGSGSAATKEEEEKEEEEKVEDEKQTEKESENEEEADNENFRLG